MTKLILICVICCLSGCYESQCGARKAVTADKAEEKAIVHATAELKAQCNNKNIFCDYMLTRSKDEIWVHVSFLFPTSWGCETSGSSFIDYVYDKNGKFLYSSTDP